MGLPWVGRPDEQEPVVEHSVGHLEEGQFEAAGIPVREANRGRR
jgi:hypothetical protein